ncbi:hypothetical protein CRM22_008952 [Opisthorchis felineus]|uniref:Uncharacterized protein n=1 Tax=Opisthorchis felineus TaxID=147828 RepID=A0A4S2L8Y1_OPIFE|nr:hypothetical protein CRM22_008952 [Opisthorchis felineus]
MMWLRRTRVNRGTADIQISRARVLHRISGVKGDLTEKQACLQLSLQAPKFWAGGLFLNCELKNYINGLGDFVLYVDANQLKAKYGNTDEHGFSWLVTRRLNNDTGDCTTASDASSRSYYSDTHGIWITGPLTPKFCEDIQGRQYNYFTVKKCTFYSKQPSKINKEPIGTYQLKLDNIADRFKVQMLLEQVNGRRPRCRYNALSITYFH